MNRISDYSQQSISLSRGGNKQTRHTFKAACSNALLAHKSLRWFRSTVCSSMPKRRAARSPSVTPWWSRCFERAWSKAIGKLLNLHLSACMVVFG